MTDAGMAPKIQRRPPRRGAGTGAPRRYSLWEWTKGYVMWFVVLPLYVALWAFAGVFKRVPDWMLRKLLREHGNYTTRRQYDVRIPFDPAVAPYMLRWWRIRKNAFFNIYFHRVLRSDEDRALHDHPWWNFSIVLHGGYYEHTIAAGGVHAKTFYPAGSVRFRPSGSFAHRLELERYSDQHPAPGLRGQEKPVLTIFITGPTLRRWGFHHPEQWVDAYDWDQFCDERGLDTNLRMEGYAEQQPQG
jgi:hypothetical protein